MSEKQLDWQNLSLFLSVARLGGLTAASKETTLSAATLGRRMHQLERALSKELFLRHDKGYSLTNEGEKLYAELTAIEQKILRYAAQPHNTSRPLVKVSAGSWTTLRLCNHLSELTSTPQDVTIRFIATEENLDIKKREAVVGIRNHRPNSSALATRKLSTVEFAPFAANRHIKQWIRVVTNTPSALWLEQNIHPNHILCEVSVPGIALELARSGQGIALLPTFIGNQIVELQQLEEPINSLTHEQWLVVIP